ncbi:MAG: ABC transporter permease subunit [Rhodobacteraceae bacterium]|nr:ABC transporter permease subunit [Paracoccaceae bacterium]
MAMADQPAGKSFRLSMLLYDTRYRSITIQVIMMLAFIASLVWLLDNMYTNLAKADKDPDFAFLSSSAGYDINQRLIEYSSQSTHARAWLVGLLNTLLVAFLGCILATVLGVSIGVMRLSKNWIVSRLMTVYVEAFRNVPVLLWIVFAMAIFIEEFPQPREFRGEDAAAAMYFWDSLALTNRGWYIPRPVFNDGSMVVVATFILAFIGTIFFGKWAKVRQETTGVILPTGWIKLAIVAVPTLVVFAFFSFTNGSREYSVVTTALAEGAELSTIDKPKVCVVSDTAQSVVLQELLRATGNKVKVAEFDTEAEARTAYQSGECNTIGVAMADLGSVEGVAATTYTHGNAILLEQPYLDGFNFKGGVHLRNSLIALWLALSLYTAAFIAEAVRAGIMAINKGQSEAAAALGLRQKRVMNLVVLPQALRVIIPPLISQYLNITKNSSLALAVGYMDVTGTLGGITLNQTGRALECILLLMITYLAISLTISTVMNLYNNSVKLKER